MNNNEKSGMDKFGEIDKISKNSDIDRVDEANYIQKNTYRAIYRLLDRVSPADFDCGELCGAACCTAEEEDMGIYLLPGEEALFAQSSEWFEWSMLDADECGFPASWQGSLPFLKCKTPPFCRRSERPIQCRTFPLMPYLTEDGHLEMLYNDNDLPYLCPLIEDEIPLNDSFVRATHTVWKHLIRDPRIYDLVQADSEEIREMLW